MTVFIILLFYVTYSIFLYYLCKTLYISDYRILPISTESFYLFAFTWGLPITLLGCLCSLAAMACGKKPYKYGHCIFFNVFKSNRTYSLGIFVFAGEDAGLYSKRYANGRCIQQAIFSVFSISVITIPQIFRWILLKTKRATHYTKTAMFDNIWYNGQAYQIGAYHAFSRIINRQTK